MPTNISDLNGHINSMKQDVKSVARDRDTRKRTMSGSGRSQGLHLGNPKHTQPTPGIYNGVYAGIKKPQSGGCAINGLFDLILR